MFPLRIYPANKTNSLRVIDPTKNIAGPHQFRSSYYVLGSHVHIIPAGALERYKVQTYIQVSKVGTVGYNMIQCFLHHKRRGIEKVTFKISWYIFSYSLPSTWLPFPNLFATWLLWCVWLWRTDRSADTENKAPYAARDSRKWSLN